MMTDRAKVVALLSEQIACPETQWSLGTFGGLAEFARDRDEPVKLDISRERLSAVTARGGLAIEPRDGIRPFASESVTSESWTHRVALCLPHDHSAMNRRSTLTELGPDNEALRAQDRDAVLFDLGLDAPQTDLCIRTSDTDTVAQLRQCAGRSLFEPGNPAMAIILAASPHRVFVSRLGRIEVYQPIPDPSGKSPEGPHTHLLPKLLRHRRTHSATEPIPEGLIPCAHLYPSHPAKDALGLPRHFDAARHDAFQTLLERFGDPAAMALKQRVIVAVTQGQPPSGFEHGEDRFARSQIRVMLRQLKAAGHKSSALRAWLSVFDRPDQTALNDDESLADAHTHDTR